MATLRIGERRDGGREDGCCSSSAVPGKRRHSSSSMRRARRTVSEAVIPAHWRRESLWRWRRMVRCNWLEGSSSASVSGGGVRRSLVRRAEGGEVSFECASGPGGGGAREDRLLALALCGSS